MMLVVDEVVYDCEGMMTVASSPESRTARHVLGH